MKKQPILISALLAVTLALVLAIRVNCEKRQFSRTVMKAYKTSEGYDQKFIDMVNRLEDVLATRAQFGYLGGKDPMTGKERRVAKPVVAIRSSIKRSSVKTRKAEDPIRLTATFSDDQSGQYSAIVMDGERSFSIEVGDVIRDRKVVNITAKVIVMKSKTHIYRYHISGEKRVQKR